MIKNKMNSTVILFLMIITGFIIYYMYLKPESFATTVPQNTINCVANPTDPSCLATYCISRPTDPKCVAYCVANPTDNYCIAVAAAKAAGTAAAIAAAAANTQPTSSNNCSVSTLTPPTSIISRYFGVGFNVYPVISNSTQSKLYLIEHIPITSNGVSGGFYSLSSDGLFTIKIKNNDDSSQWWSITNYKETGTNLSYEIVQPFSKNSMALQYANGSLSITPYTYPGFESQKWLKSQIAVTRGIPVLNINPASMFTTEFDPYSTTNSISTNLTDSNNVQVNNVINSVKTGIQQYLSQINPSSQITSSSLGNKNMPLSVNLNLSGSGGSSGSSAGDGFTDTKGISFFDNVTGSTSTNDMLSILDRYNSNTNSQSSQSIYNNSNSLENQLNQTNNGCKLFNINDYMSNRVSTCNCKL
jgi:hypothetical protein